LTLLNHKSASTAISAIWGDAETESGAKDEIPNVAAPAARDPRNSLRGVLDWLSVVIVMGFCEGSAVNCEDRKEGSGKKNEKKEGLPFHRLNRFLSVWRRS
jgi:hypothetical protein